MFVLALPIFPARHPASIVGADELNFCVRDGNRWTLVAINTNYLIKKSGDPYRIRTDVKGVRGLCLNHLTNGPHFSSISSAEAVETWYTFRDSNPGHPD